MPDGVRLPWSGEYWGECCAVCGRSGGLYRMEAKYHLGYGKYQVVIARFCSNHYAKGREVTATYRRAQGWTIVHSF